MRIALASDAANRRSRRLRWTAMAAAMLAIGLGAAVFETPRNRLVAVATGNRAPVLDIGIQFKDLHPIHQQRSAALETGRLVISDAAAPVTLKLNGQSVQARLRLVAGPIEDLAGDKWPMGLRVAKGEHLFGQRALTLTPVSSESLVDALFLEHLGRLEGLSARLLLVDAVLNGRRLGTMALAELPSTELLERQQRRDGVVVRVNEKGDVRGDASRVAVALEPKRIGSSRQLTADLARAQEILAAAIGRTRPADQLFDAESMGRFLAVAEHWNRASLLHWDQLRFYLNPMTSRLEPIGAAYSPSSTETAAAKRTQPLSITETPFMKQMLANPKIRAAFETTTREIATEFSDGTAWSRATEQERSLRRLLNRDDPRSPDDVLTALQSARRHDDSASPRQRDSGTAHVAAPDPLYESNDPLDPLPHRSIEEVLARHPFLDWDPVEQSFRARPGNHGVRGSIILPDGAGLRMSSGTVLRFEPRAGLIARGPLRFDGSADAPIVLEGPPGTKRSQLWSGVYLIESERDSHWKHVVVRNTSGFKRAGWSLPGGVVFRKTHVELDHCAFLNSLADDALNLVRTTFALRDIEVQGAASDAVDFDYSEGRIEGALISQAAGDGFDLGGSRVEMSDVRVADIEDKAVSVGERSELVVRALDVDRVSIGIASKNSSRARVSDSTFRRVSLVGLIAYRNQTVYESAVIFADGNRFEQTARQALAELGSRIVVDGDEWPVADISIASVAAVAATE